MKIFNTGTGVALGLIVAAISPAVGAPAVIYNALTGATSTDVGLVASPSDVDFAAVDISKVPSVLQTTTIYNHTPQSLHLTLGELPDGAVTADATSCTSNAEGLLPNAACAIAVTWSPHQAGRLSTGVIVHSEVADLVIKLMGTASGNFSARPNGGSGAVLVTDPASIDFGPATPVGGTDVVLVSNAGDRAAAITNISVAPGGEPLALGGSCMVADHPQLWPGHSCVLTVTLTMPTQVRSGIIVEHDGLRGALSIPVKAGSEQSGRLPAPSGGQGPTTQSGDAVPEMPRHAEAAAMSIKAEPRPVAWGDNDVLLSLGGHLEPYGLGDRVDLDGRQWVLAALRQPCVTLRAGAVTRDLCQVSQRSGGATPPPLSHGNNHIEALDRLINETSR
jgi:hypothetical protein